LQDTTWIISNLNSRDTQDNCKKKKRLKDKQAVYKTLHSHFQ